MTSGQRLSELNGDATPDCIIEAQANVAGKIGRVHC
jgi:hypothetical protein